MSQGALETMREIDLAYRSVSRIESRRFYKIFYSHIHSFPLMTMGLNPGGEVGEDDLSASESFFEGWEHDFVHFRFCKEYRLARPMYDLLAYGLGTESPEILRQVPTTNVCFRRSRKSGNLRKDEAAIEARPFVSRIIEVVNPRCVLLTSKVAYDVFVGYHCAKGSVFPDPFPKIYTENGASSACIFLRSRGFVTALGREVALVMVGHPSKYGSRSQWSTVQFCFRTTMQKLGIVPIDESSIMANLPPICPYR